MRHGILLFALLVLLVGVAGGVFVLVQQGGEEQKIPEETLTASVSAGEKAGELAESASRIQASPPQSSKAGLGGEEQSIETQPTAKQVAPSPIAPKPPVVPPPVASFTPTSTPSLAVEPIPSPPTAGPVPPPSPSPISFPININTAGYEELQEITGVGEVIAQRIIDYRILNGPFQTIEEIKDVKGIGDATFEKMKDEITV